eukprot:RCo046959
MELLYPLLNSLPREQLLVAKKLDQPFRVRFPNGQGGLVRSGHFGVPEELSYVLDGEQLWDFILGPVQGLHKSFNGLVLLDPLVRLCRADPSDLGAVVTAQQDASVNKLIHGELQAVQHSLQVDLQDGQLLCLRGIQVPEKSGSTKSQGIHVLCSHCPAPPTLHQRRTRRLGLRGSLNYGKAHESEQLLALLGLLLRDPHRALVQAKRLLLLALLLSGLQVSHGLGLPGLTRGQDFTLQLGRGPVKDVHRLQPIGQHLQGAVPHPLQVAGDLPLLVGQLTLSAQGALHRNDKLVDAHAGVDRNAAAEVVLQGVLLHRPGSLLRY